MKINFGILLFSIFFLSSCISENEKQINTYFSLNDFFKTEIIKLNKQNKTIRKEIKNNKISEKQNISIIDWNKELEIFKECDINKPAWKSEYHIESEKLGNEKIIRYTTLNDNLIIKNICIKLDSSKKVNEIQINKATNNNLYSSEEELIYSVKSGYSIKRNQKVFLLGNSNLYINVKFTP